MTGPRQTRLQWRRARRERSAVAAAGLVSMLLAGCTGVETDGSAGATAEAETGVGADVADGSGTDAPVDPDVTETGSPEGDGDATDGASRDDDPSDDRASDDLPDDVPDSGTTDPPSDDGAAGDTRDPDTSHLADLTSAEPGTWPVGDAGTVTFDLQGRDLVLRDIEGRAGWSITVEEDERDEIEVDFRRGDVRWRLLVERSGRHLDVAIEQRVRGAAGGGYDLGDAGTFAFDVVDGRLVLTSLEVADGWSVRDEDVDDEDIELDLRADGRRVEVEVELDGRSVELTIVYQVRDRIR